METERREERVWSVEGGEQGRGTFARVDLRRNSGPALGQGLNQDQRRGEERRRAGNLRGEARAEVANEGSFIARHNYRIQQLSTQHSVDLEKDEKATRIP
eukprot:753111-Hanusia_phi.AAC.1